MTKIVLSASRDIPLNKLMLSQANVRRIKAGVSVDELAEDIARRGLLQSLSVRPVLDEQGQETGTYEVPAGGRRPARLRTPDECRAPEQCRGRGIRVSSRPAAPRRTATWPSSGNTARHGPAPRQCAAHVGGPEPARPPAPSHLASSSQRSSPSSR